MTVKGVKLTQEHKLNMSLAQKKRFANGGPMKGKRFSEEHRRKMSEAKRGEKCIHWKGGRRLLNKLIRETFKYRQWRSDIFTRDDFSCLFCSKRGGKIHAHHKKELSQIMDDNKITVVEQALACEELWDINNGMTLCEICHRLIHKRKYT